MKKFIKTALFVSVFILGLSMTTSADETCLTAYIECENGSVHAVLACGNTPRELANDIIESGFALCR
jgi:hypothetical protein